MLFNNKQSKSFNTLVKKERIMSRIINNKQIKFIITIILIILTSNSCKKESFNIQNLNNNTITVLGHGGMGVGKTYPLNTFESLMKCLNYGADGTEMDVQMTKDSVLVAFHDQDLSDGTNFHGLINSYTWDEIKNARFNKTPYLNYSITSLDNFFSNISDVKKYKYTFDCKLYSEKVDEKLLETYSNSIIRLIEKFDIQNNVCIESPRKDFLSIMKTKRSNYKLFIYSSFQNGLELASELNLSGITISTRDITKEQVDIAHAQGLLIATWNTHTKKENIDAIKKNPDFIQTDKVKYLIKILK